MFANINHMYPLRIFLCLRVLFVDESVHYQKVKANCKMQPRQWYALDLSSASKYRYNLGRACHKNRRRHLLNRNQNKLFIFRGALNYV